MKQIVWFGVAAALVLVLLGLLPSVQGSIWAQDAQPVTEISPDEVNEVARELWCPLCSGVRLDSCELKACDQMKEVIALKLADGEDTESIKAYFVEQYGPQVLGEPPLEGVNWLGWIAPFAALIIGGVFVWMKMRQMVRPLEPAAASPSRSVQMVSNGSDSAGAEDGRTQDEYAAKLEEELTKYG